MNIKNYCVSLAFLLCALVARGQENRTEICIDFRVNKTNVDSSYSDNAIRMQEIISILQNIRKDSTVRMVEVSFCGAASPEGSAQQNRKLAQGRLAALEKLVRQEVEIPDSIITRNDSSISWDILKSQIAESEFAHKEEVLAILDEEARIDNRIVKLRQLDGGKVWQAINSQFLSRMRNACTVLVTYRKEPQPVQESDILPEPVAVDPEQVVVDPEPVAPVVPEPEGWTRQLHVKTNALGLGLGIANAAVEMDLGKHWSFTLPVYYSAWNYFKTTVKFRTLAVQPELRYWPHPDNQGWFAGAHFGLAYFNLAINGDYRYQDRNQNSPAIGGGVTLGYRTRLSADNRWNLEFALGAGCYDVHYDKYYNVENGKLVSNRRKTYIGVDQVSISLSYCINLKNRKK